MQKKSVVNPFFTHPVCCCCIVNIFRECVLKYKDFIVLFNRFLKFVSKSFQHQTFNSRVCLKGTRDIILSDLSFMEWHVRLTFTRQETLVFTNHQSDKGIHGTIGNRSWPSLNGGSLEIIIVYLTSLKNRHVLEHFIE